MAALKTKSRKVAEPKFAVEHYGLSGGPKFTSLTEALAYARHVLKNGDARSLTIIPLAERR